MEAFKSLFDNLANKGWVYSDQLLSKPTVEIWRNLALEKLDQGQFRPAQIASGTLPNVRSDSILWLDESDKEFQTYFQTLHIWRKNICQELFVSAPQVETHLAHYAPGKFYEKHCDQPKNSGSRVITFVVYLHESWSVDNGGELIIYENSSDEIACKIDPQPGRVVFFKSDEIWHQVQESRFDRLSLTGWFRHP